MGRGGGRRFPGGSLHDLPSELTLDPLDGGGRRRGARCEDTDSRSGPLAQLGGRPGKPDQHGRRGAQQGDPFALDGIEDRGRLDFPQADVRAAHGRYYPHERPAVGVKHRQRPQVTIGGGHGLM